jgi:hypothetical protein
MTLLQTLQGIGAFIDLGPVLQKLLRLEKDNFYE